MSSCQVPEGYKQTEVGVIPEDWEVQHLAQVTSLDVGYAFKSSSYQKDTGIPLLRGENVGYGSPDWSDTRRLSEQDAKSFSTYLLHPGDIVIGMDRTFTKSGTKISLLRENDCPCLLVQRVGRFVPLVCSASFLWALLSSPKFQSSLQLEQKGMDIPHLSRSEILQPYVALPPATAEQEAIATALSDVDALIAALDKLIAKKRHLKTATMQQLLTGKKRLPGFGEGKGYKQTEVGVIPEDWEVFQFSDITTLITCGIAATPEYVPAGQGYPFLSSSNVKSGTILWSNFKYITEELHKQLYKNNPPQKGDVLYSRVGTIGEAAVIEVDFEFSIYVSLTLIKPSRNLDS
jgi:restriction endonuclease S subunit